jgi:DnaJ-class molecular chaperone
MSELDIIMEPGKHNYGICVLCGGKGGKIIPGTYNILKICNICDGKGVIPKSNKIIKLSERR